MIYTTESLKIGSLATLMQMFSAEAPKLVGELCVSVGSNGDKETHEWLGQPKMLETWNGTRQFGDMTGTDFEITNVEYDGGLVILRKHLSDNRSGSIQMRINDFFRQAVGHPNKVINALIVAGTSGLCYDGTAFFGNSHPARADEGGVQDNLLAGTGTTVAQITADISDQVIPALLTYKGENGENYHGDGFEDLVIYCPPAMETNFKQALNATQISSGDNPIKGVGRVVRGARLTDANDWYAFVGDPGRKPLIWQPREPLVADVLGTDTETYINKKQIQMGLSYRAGAGYGRWQSAVKVVNS